MQFGTRRSSGPNIAIRFEQSLDIAREIGYLDRAARTLNEMEIITRHIGNWTWPKNNSKKFSPSALRQRANPICDSLGRYHNCY
jgi:hypothetical protein